MLAYVFWHWPQTGVDPGIYEKNLCRFHEVLFDNKPEGFRYSRVLKIEQAPWIGRSDRTFEDWYAIDGSAVLDALNEQAVSGPCEQPHKQISRLTLAGAAGLYRLKFGTASLPVIRFEYRFDKPQGVDYRSFYSNLESNLSETEGALWTRQMNLAPGPEFCLHSTNEVALPRDIPATRTPVDQVCFTSPL